MTRKEALEALLAKVEAGAATMPEIHAVLQRDGLNSTSAYNGSLDAAKALHEAVLPDWGYLDLLRRGQRHTARISVDVFCKTETGVSDSLARAWLIAIIKALISMEPEA